MSELPPTPAPLPPPIAPPPGLPASTMHPLLCAIISFFLPGLGLLPLGRTQDAFIILGIYLGVNVVIWSLMAVTCGCLHFATFIIPAYAAIAAIHSYDEAMLAMGQQPVLFKHGYTFMKK